MLYLSQLLGVPVDNQQGERVGKITDVLVPAAQIGQSAAVYPDRLLVEGEDERFLLVTLDAIERLDGALRLRVPVEQLERQAEEPLEQEIYLARDVLDKQIIDISRKKAVRVNDICFGDDWQVLGVDDSVFGVVRRIAPPWLLGASGRRVSTALIPWKRVELVGGQNMEDQEERVETGPHPVVRSPSGHLADLHPADIAEIVHQLTPGQGARLIEGLDDETAADTMEEIDTERQRHILENIEAERAADILQAMGPDEAADLLAQLPEDRAQELLRLMNPEESEDVRELLGYEANTAGGLMTTDYIVLDQTRTVAEALASVRANILENDVRIAYIYCTEDETQEEQRVLGVVSLWDLLAADTTRVLRDLMETDVVTVQPDSDAHTVAEIMAKYNLLAVPVVNADGILEGVVTVDDALDVLLPPERRRRPPRMY